MDIRNKIVVRTGALFENLGASALVVNAACKGSVTANELAFYGVDGGKLKMIKVSDVAVADVANALIKISSNGRNLFICRQGDNEPYNKPDITDGGYVNPALNAMMKPLNHFVRLADAVILTDVTKMIADSDSQTVIGDFAAGKKIVVRDYTGGTEAHNLIVKVVAAEDATAGDIFVGLIETVDTSDAAYPVVQIVC